MDGPVQIPSSRTHCAGSTAVRVPMRGIRRRSDLEAGSVRHSAGTSMRRRRQRAGGQGRTVQPRRAVQRAPAIRIASGRPAQAPSTWRTLPARHRRVCPTMRVNSSVASSCEESRSISGCRQGRRAGAGSGHDHGARASTRKAGAMTGRSRDHRARSALPLGQGGRVHGGAVPRLTVPDPPLRGP